MSCDLRMAGMEMGQRIGIQQVHYESCAGATSGRLRAA
jgi:hypothetical protein